MSTKQLPQPGKLQLPPAFRTLAVTLTQPRPPGPHPLPPSGASPPCPPGKRRRRAEKGVWGLVPGTSPVGWRWAHLKVSEHLASVSFSGVRSRRMDSSQPEDTGTHCGFLVIGSPFPRQLPGLALSANPLCPQGQKQGLGVKAQEQGCPQVLQGPGLGQSSFPGRFSPKGPRAGRGPGRSAPAPSTQAPTRKMC